MARKRKSDAKEAALAETRTLNPRPEAVRDEQFVSWSSSMPAIWCR